MGATLRPAVAAALVDDATARAAAVLTEAEMELVTIRLVDDDDDEGEGGPYLSYRGPQELIDRIEAALYPADDGGPPPDPDRGRAAE